MRDLYHIFAHVAYSRGSVLLRQCDEIPSGRGNFGGFDHSVCQASANRSLENSERRRCGLSSGKGSDGSTQRGRSVISTIALFNFSFT